MKTLKSNLNHFILAHILLGHEIEAYMIFDAGGPNTVAVCHGETAEIALWRARGENLAKYVTAAMALKRAGGMFTAGV